MTIVDSKAIKSYVSRKTTFKDGKILIDIPVPAAGDVVSIDGKEYEVLGIEMVPNESASWGSNAMRLSVKEHKKFSIKSFELPAELDIVDKKYKEEIAKRMKP